MDQAALKNQGMNGSRHKKTQVVRPIKMFHTQGRFRMVLTTNPPPQEE